MFIYFYWEAALSFWLVGMVHTVVGLTAPWEGWLQALSDCWSCWPEGCPPRVTVGKREGLRQDSPSAVPCGAPTLDPLCGSSVTSVSAVSLCEAPGPPRQVLPRQIFHHNWSSGDPQGGERFLHEHWPSPPFLRIRAHTKEDYPYTGWNLLLFLPNSMFLYKTLELSSTVGS